MLSSRGPDQRPKGGRRTGDAPQPGSRQWECPSGTRLLGWAQGFPPFCDITPVANGCHCRAGGGRSWRGWATILDRASVRGLASLPPRDGIRGFGRPTSLRAFRPGESVLRDRDGLAAPVVQVVVVRDRVEAGADYAAASLGLSTPVSNRPPETHMRCVITTSWTMWQRASWL